MAYQKPKPWLFNPDDYERAYKSGAFWTLPKRLVTDTDWQERWRMLWKAADRAPGGGVATSILPVLATHVFPEIRATVGAGATTSPTPASIDLSQISFAARVADVRPRRRTRDEWTPEYTLSRRRIAALAGVNKDSVATGFDLLRDAGFLRYERRPNSNGAGGYQTYYRLATTLYAQGDEPFFRFPKALLYGGLWALLPTHACRHLYLTIACLDPIHDEDEYVEKALDVPSRNIDDETEIDALRLLRERRAARPLRLTKLQELTGVTRPAARRALRVLCEPVVSLPARGEQAALLQYGEVPPQRDRFWYAPDYRVLTARATWFRPFGSKDLLAKARGQLWPENLPRLDGLPF